ncbi:MAG: hypothetical protein V1746_01705 [bacterium]
MARNKEKWRSHREEHGETANKVPDKTPAQAAEKPGLWQRTKDKLGLGDKVANAANALNPQGGQQAGQAPASGMVSAKVAPHAKLAEVAAQMSNEQVSTMGTLDIVKGVANLPRTLLAYKGKIAAVVGAVGLVAGGKAVYDAVKGEKDPHQEEGKDVSTKQRTPSFPPNPLDADAPESGPGVTLTPHVAEAGGICP